MRPTSVARWVATPSASSGRKSEVDSGCSAPKNQGKAKPADFLAKHKRHGVITRRSLVQDLPPQPKKSHTPSGVWDFFCFVDVSGLERTTFGIMSPTSVARSRRRKLQFIFPPFIWCKAGVFFKHSAKMRAGGKAGTFRYYIY